MLICPIDWYLSDDLKESIAIQYFSKKANNVYLFVNDSTEVKAIGVD